MEIKANSGNAYVISIDVTYVEGEEELPTSWNFTADGGFTTAVTDAEYQSLKVSGTLRPNNNSAQISSGGSISVPVTGTCDIKVVGYPGYYDYAVNGTTVSSADETIRYTYTGSNGEVEYVEIKANSGNAYVISIDVTYVEDGAIQYATVSGSVDTALNGEKLIFSDGASTFETTVSNGAYTVQLPIGATYTVSFEKAIYSITSGASVDLSSATEGAAITNNITYEELENRLVLDGPEVTWNFVDASFGAYSTCTSTTSEWLSGDGLTITGKFEKHNSNHGTVYKASNQTVWSIHVPAGQTTITFGGCKEGAGSVSISCEGTLLKDLSLKTAADSDETTFIYTSDKETTIDIAATNTSGSGYLHYMKAKTITPLPTAKVSGSVDSSVNGEEIQFLVGSAAVASTTIADGKYSADVPIGSKYTVAFTNANLYEVTGGATVDLTNVAAGTAVTNNITFKKWDTTKTVTLTLGDTTFTVTPGADKSQNFTVAATSGTGNVEIGNNEKTILWTNLGGQGGGVLSSDKITNVSNATTTFSGNTLTIKYSDTTTNPASYQLIVKDNSATGAAVADGSTVEYDLKDESIVSSMYTNSNRLSGGKSVHSTDKIVTLTGNSGIYYNGSHGIYINANDTISVNVAGDATVSFSVCAYSGSDGLLTATAPTGTITPASGSAKATTDGDSITFDYTGAATTLTFTYTGGTGYIHSLAVKNKAQSSPVANQQTEMPEVKTTVGTASNLEAIPVGQRFMFTQTNGKMTQPDGANSIDSSVSYFGFPETTGKYKLEADVILSTCGSSNYNGIYFGAFDEDYVATIAIRNSTGLRGILSKSSLDLAGASTVDETIEKGQKVHFTAEKTDACFVVTATPEDGETYTMEFDYNDSGVLLFKEQGINTPVSFGFAIAGSSAIVTNMKYYNAAGTLVYDQNDCYDPVGTAPIVAGVAAQAATTREYITVNWTSSVAVVGDGRYVVQVSKDGSAYTTIKELTAATLDYPITEAGTYTFRVAGKLGEEGATNTWVYSSPLTVIAALTKPVVEISATASTVSLSWDAVEKANKYEVYRYSYDEGEENATVIATVTSTSYTDTSVSAEMPYYYNVVAYSSDNYSNPSETVWAVASAGHTGDYVYESEATEIFLTKKSYDTVFNGKAVLEGMVMGNGTLQATVNGSVAKEQALSAKGTFSFTLDLAQGRNDVNLLFTDANGNVTRQTYNFVYLTNYDRVVDAAYTGTDGVSVDGIPTYSTVQGAVDAASAGDIILVLAGSYEERLVVNKANITIIGEDRESTLVHFYPGVLGSDYEAGQDMTKRCATYIQEGASGFAAENISFANDYVYSTPDGKSNKSADALRCDADDATFVNVRFDSVQDTLYMGKGHQYYYKCRIEGLVDFIYSGDDARAFFNDCDIVFTYESTKKGGYVCAPKTDEDATYGLTFYNCVITGEEGCSGNGYLLARPWGPDAYITWIDCYMGESVYDVLPYGDMSGNLYTEARFFEFGSYGPGYAINADRRQISPNKAAEMISDSFLEWSPATVSAAVSASYVGSVVTNRAPQYVSNTYTGSDKYSWTDGNDTGLAKYNQEGYAESYGVSGGGLLLETSDNYYKAGSAEEFLDALLAVKESGKKSVIEITSDINLGCKEVSNYDSYSSIISAYKAQPLTHPTLIQSGVSVLSIEDMYNLTIFSQNGSSIKHANITMKNSGNIIIRNIKFDELWEWDEDTEGNYDRNDWDFMTIDNACDGVWIDHCTFYKAYDGIVDMKNPANEMNVTVSWCEFLAGSEDNVFFNVMMDELANNASKYPYYSHLLEAGMTKEQIYMYAYGQKKTHLLGQSDSAENAVGIRATFANNVYTDSMDRMPRLRYGVAHVYNCIMDAQTLLDARRSITNEDVAKKIVSNGAASTCGAQVLLENCYISGIQNALNSGNGSSPSGYINAINSAYYMDGVKTALAPKANSTEDSRVLVTDADEFIGKLPYSGYVLCNAESLDEYVTPYAGAGKLALTVLQWEKESYNDSQEVVTPLPSDPTVPSVPDVEDEDEDDDDDDTVVDSGVSAPSTATPSQSTTKKPSANVKPVAPTVEKSTYKSEVKELDESMVTDVIKESTGCKNLADLINFLIEKLMEASADTKNDTVFAGIEKDNTKVVDITIRVSEDGGQTWVEATKDNFPKDGIDVTIPYPEGIDRDKYDFVIGHLITMGINGAEIGSMEYYNPVKTEEGLQIHITSASPFIVGWKEIEAGATTVNPVVEPEKTVDAVVEAPEVVEEASASNGWIIWALSIVLIFVASAAGYVVYNKKKNEQ